MQNEYSDDVWNVALTTYHRHLDTLRNIETNNFFFPTRKDKDAQIEKSKAIYQDQLAQLFTTGENYWSVSEITVRKAAW